MVHFFSRLFLSHKIIARSLTSATAVLSNSYYCNLAKLGKEKSVCGRYSWHLQHRETKVKILEKE